MEKKRNNINRRDFIKGSAMAVAGMALGGSAVAKAFTSSTEKYTVGKNFDFEKRKLGNLEVTALGYGCMNIAWAYGPQTDRKKIHRTYSHRLRAGHSFLRHGGNLRTVLQRRDAWRGT